MTRPNRRGTLDGATARRYARAAGLLYLVIIVGAGFAEGYVRAGVIVPGDAAATAANIRAAEGLFRLGLVADLAAFLSDAAVAVLLYVLLRPVSRTISLLAAAFRLVAHPAIGGINLLNHLAPALLLGDAGYRTALEPEALEALSLFFLEAHGYGYLIAGAFFGVSLLLLGWLVFRAAYLPRVLGVLLALAGAGYLIESFGTVVYPAGEAVFTWIVTVPAVLGEVGLALWLVAKGVDADRFPAGG